MSLPTLKIIFGFVFLFLKLLASSQRKVIETISNQTLVAFGDSLTRGYISWDRNQAHPYTIKLSEKIRSSNTTVVTLGLDGEETTHMKIRLKAFLEEYSLVDKLPSIRLVVILGGTNDLSYRSPAQDIFFNLREMHASVHNFNLQTTCVVGRTPIYTLALTIPNSDWGFDEAVRLQVNELIRIYVHSCPYVALVDLESIFPHTDEGNRLYWIEDKGHFSSLGYDIIGERVYDALSAFHAPYSPASHTLC